MPHVTSPVRPAARLDPSHGLPGPTSRPIVPHRSPPTPEERIPHYTPTPPYPQSPFLGGDGRIVGTRITRNDCRATSPIYGSYPNGHLRRVRAPFPDKGSAPHPFTDRVDPGARPGDTPDVNPETGPTRLRDTRQNLGGAPLASYDVVPPDPPYSVEAPERCSTTTVTRNKAPRRRPTGRRPGTRLLRPDRAPPIHRRADRAITGLIGTVRSTDHRFRPVTIPPFTETRLRGSTDRSRRRPAALQHVGRREATRAQQRAARRAVPTGDPTPPTPCQRYGGKSRRTRRVLPGAAPDAAGTPPHEPSRPDPGRLAGQSPRTPATGRRPSRPTARNATGARKVSETALLVVDVALLIACTFCTLRMLGSVARDVRRARARTVHRNEPDPAKGRDAERRILERNAYSVTAECIGRALRNRLRPGRARPFLKRQWNTMIGRPEEPGRPHADPA